MFVPHFDLFCGDSRSKTLLMVMSSTSLSLNRSEVRTNQAKSIHNTAYHIDITVLL